MGIWDKWSEVLDAYRDVNQLLGDIVKVRACVLVYVSLLSTMESSSSLILLPHQPATNNR